MVEEGEDDRVNIAPMQPSSIMVFLMIGSPARYEKAAAQDRFIWPSSDTIKIVLIISIKSRASVVNDS